jgi:metal-responsive CopG/Arc/MetJ family transcriptional regulator
MLKRKEGKNLRKVTLSLEEELWVALKIMAAKERTSMSDLVERAAARYLAEREGKGRGKKKP